MKPGQSPHGHKGAERHDFPPANPLKQLQQAKDKPAWKGRPVQKKGYCLLIVALLIALPAYLFSQSTAVPINPPAGEYKDLGEDRQPAFYLNRSFVVAPLWLSNDLNPADKVVFYLTADSVGIGPDYLKAWDTEQPATFTRSLDAVADWLTDVYHIQSGAYTMRFISVRDGKTRSLQILLSGKVVAIYSTIPTVYFARAKGR